MQNGRYVSYMLRDMDDMSMSVTDCVTSGCGCLLLKDD